MNSDFVIVHLNEDFLAQQRKRQLNVLSILEKYFSDEILTSGGELDEKLTRVDVEQLKAFIYFIECGVAQRVAERKKISIGLVSFYVELGKPSIVIRRPVLIDGNNVGIQ